MQTMKLSAAGRQVLKNYETGKDARTGKLFAQGTPALRAYKCDAGRWTCGWGCTGANVTSKTVWTMAQAVSEFERMVARFEGWVNELILSTPTTQGQFDAMVLFAYNVGPDIDKDNIAEGLGDSSLLRLHNARRYAEAADEFPKWNKGGGVVMKGLVRRRAQERVCYLTGSWA